MFEVPGAHRCGGHGDGDRGVRVAGDGGGVRAGGRALRGGRAGRRAARAAPVLRRPRRCSHHLLRAETACLVTWFLYCICFV